MRWGRGDMAAMMAVADSMERSDVMIIMAGFRWDRER